jgi:hypothetical protein
MARQKERFLEEFRRRGIVKDAAEAVGINRRTTYNWLKRDVAFAEAFRDAEEEVGDDLEGETRRRAMGEVQEPVYYRGKVVGYMPRYSDKLLMLLLRARRPEKYREGCQHQAGNRDERPVFPLAALRALVDDDE